MKIKYDVTGVDAAGDFEQPKPGLYRAKIIEINGPRPSNANPDNELLEVIMEIKKGEFKGARLWTYPILNNDAVASRLREFTDAVGLTAPGKKAKEKGAFDPDDLLGVELQVRVKGDTYEGEYKAKVGSLMPLPDDEDDDDDDEEPDTDDGAADDEDDGDEEEITYAEVMAMDKDELVELIEELEESEEIEEGAVKYTARTPVKKLRTLMCEALELEEEEEEEPEEEDEDEDEDDGYDEMSMDDLKKELKDRELRTAGKKSVLIARLRKDDQSEEDPF